LPISYYAVFNYDQYDKTERKYGLSILFPDLPEANTCARNDREGYEMAVDVLHLCLLDRDEREFPIPTPLADIPLKTGERAVLIPYSPEAVGRNKFHYFPYPEESP